jgi:ketosteroid isomerase-like protein
MSQENVEAFRQVQDAINRADVDAALRLVAEDVVIKAARSGVEGDYRGHDGVRKWFADNADNFAVFRLSYDDVRDLGDRVLAIGTIHIRGKGSGIETDIPTAGVARFRDGRATSWEDFRERRLALEAVGLRE